MYCVYKTTNPWVANDFLNDLKLLATGTTDVNDLSSSCDKANSSILNTVAAGWTLHDDAAGTGQKVLSCADADAVTTKYLHINTSQSGYLRFRAYDQWNATNHTGTNPSYSDSMSTTAGTINAGVSAFIYIWMTPRYIAVSSFHSGGFHGAIVSGEIDRATGASDYLSIGNAKQVHVILGQNSSAYMSTIKMAHSAGTYTDSNAICEICMNEFQNPPRNLNETYRHPVWRTTLKTYHGSAYIGLFKDLYSIPPGGAAILDEITINAVNYQLVFGRNAQNICIRKG